MVNSILALLCFALAPFVTGIILGTPVILLMAKLQKPWGFFTFGILSPILLWLSGHNSFIPAIGGILLAAIAEFILYLGKYKSFKAMLVAYACYNIWTMLPLADILFVRAKRLKMIQKMGLALTLSYFSMCRFNKQLIIFTDLFFFLIPYHLRHHFPIVSTMNSVSYRYLENILAYTCHTLCFLLYIID